MRSYYAHVMPGDVEDFRPVSQWGALRAVCHGCRQTTHVRLEGDDEVPILRPMVVPGRGVIYAEKAPGVMTEQPCPECGESNTAGWVPGYRPSA